jgi:hypothetical protein
LHNQHTSAGLPLSTRTKNCFGIYWFTGLVWPHYRKAQIKRNANPCPMRWATHAARIARGKLHTGFW